MTFFFYPFFYVLFCFSWRHRRPWVSLRCKVFVLWKVPFLTKSLWVTDNVWCVRSVPQKIRLPNSKWIRRIEAAFVLIRRHVFVIDSSGCFRSSFIFAFTCCVLLITERVFSYSVYLWVQVHFINMASVQIKKCKIWNMYMTGSHLTCKALKQPEFQNVEVCRHSITWNLKKENKPV